MTKRAIARFIAVCVFAAVITPACTVLPKATVYVVDESGRPIAHAQINPYPFDHGTNVSDSQGKAHLYMVENMTEYTVDATGYHTANIVFPGEAKTIIVILKPDPRALLLEGD
jgi:hypothetical protein